MSVLNNMINFDFKEKCYSCSACAEACPTKAISFDENIHPEIDLQKCINCNRCERVCIELNKPEDIEELNCIEGYIVKNKNNEIRKVSSSGGVFFQIAQKVLEMDGYVCGCIYDDEFMPKHIVSNEIEICKKMMGSKYVKSDLNDCIVKIKQIVEKGKIVLFSGVPCQVAAVKKCVKSDKLITLAVVCHGSIERKIWKKYLAEEERMSGSSIIKVSMRDKTKGCLNYGLKFQFKNGTEYITFRKNDGYFLKCFTDGLFERNRCLSCEYKGQNIMSDLLIGDAWGMEKVCPEFTDSLGCSAVLVLTEKGKKIFNEVEKYFLIRNVDSQEIIRNNPRIILPAPRNTFQKSFEKKLEKSDANIHFWTEKYAKPTILNRIKWKVLGGEN